MSNFEFEDPIPNEPQTRSQGRMVWAWLFLLLLFSFLIGSQLQDYLASGSQSTFDAITTDRELKQAVSLKESQKIFGNLAAMSGESAKNENQKKQTASEEQIFKTLISRLAIARKKDPTAARFYIVTRYEVGEKIPPEEFEILKKNPTERNLAAVKIYSSEKLGEGELTALGKDLNANTTIDTMMMIHAREKAGLNGNRGTHFPIWKQITFTVLLFGACAAVAVGALLLGAYLARLASGKLTPKGHPAGLLSAPKGDRFALRAFTLLTGFFLTGGLASYAIQENFPSLEPFSTPISMISAGLILFWIMKSNFDRTDVTFLKIGIRFDQLKGDIVWGIMGYLANLPLLVAAMFLGLTLFPNLPPPSHPLTTELTLSGNPLAVLGLFFGAAVAAPILEEITFRGVLTPALHSLVGSKAGAIIFNGFLFAAIHPTGIPAWPALAMVGITSAVLAYQRQSIIPCIVMHAIHNAALVAMTLVS